MGVIIHCIQEQLGPHYTTLIDAVGFSVWAAEWRIDPTDDLLYYRGANPENRATREALKEGINPDEP